MNKPAILLLGSQMAIGGAQKVLLTQACWLHERGYAVTVVFFYDREGLYEKWKNRLPCRLVNLDSWRQERSLLNPFRLGRGLVCLTWLIIRGHFTAVETFTHHANLFGLPVAWLMGVPVRVATHHGKVQNFSSRLYRLHSRLINSRLTTVLVAVSDEVRNQAVDAEGIQRQKIVVIRNGIDFVDNDLELEDRQDCRLELGVANNGHVLLTVARLREPKGHTYLLDAIPAVLEEFPQTIFAFAGEGSFRKMLEEKSGNLGIGRAVCFLGSRDDIPRLLAGADIFVLPSISEGLPLALIEAMGQGVPVIASGVGGVGSLIHDNETGLSVPPANAVELSRAIIQLLEDEPFRKKMGEAGRTLVRKEFDVDSMGKAYQKIFLRER